MLEIAVWSTFYAFIC